RHAADLHPCVLSGRRSSTRRSSNHKRSPSAPKTKPAPVDIPQSDITVMGIVKAKLEPKKAKALVIPKQEPKVELNFDLGVSNAFPEDYTDTADNFLCIKITDHKEGQCR